MRLNNLLIGHFFIVRYASGSFLSYTQNFSLTIHVFTGTIRLNCMTIIVTLSKAFQLLKVLER